MKNFLRTSVVLFIFTLFLAGCSKDSGSNPVNDNTNNQNTNTGTSWTIESLQPTGASGTSPQIAVDNSGNPCITYLDYTDGYVKFAEKKGTSWVISNIEYVADTHGTLANRGISSLALDGQGNPHVVFLSGNGFDPTYGTGSVKYKYAKRVGGSWTIKTIDLPIDPDMSYTQVFSEAGDCSIAVNKSTGEVHIALAMWGKLGEALGYWNSVSNTVMIVDKGVDSDPGQHNCIALDSRGYPGISYQAKSAKTLKLAQWNGSAFNIETIGSMEVVYWENKLTSLAYDLNNNPHIAYINYPNYMYTYKSGSSWKTETTPYTSAYPSLSISLDQSNKPHFGFVGGSVKYASWDGTKWYFDTIESDGETCAIAVDKSGKIHLAYCINKDGDAVIKYAVK